MHPSRQPATRLPADTIWYVSARAREQGKITQRLADSLEFGYVIATRRSTGDPLTGKLSLELTDSVVLSRASFIAALRTRAATDASADSVAVLYVHGYGSWQWEAFTHAAHAYARSQSRAPWVVFSWPSNGAGIARPRVGAIVASAYWEDVNRAEVSRPAFASALRAVVDATGSAHTMVVAHSMGSQLVAEAFVSDDSLRRQLTADPLRSVAFFAPDVSASRFQEVLLPAAQLLSSRVILYASSNDRLLAFSKSINKGERAGLIRGSPPRPIIAARLETIDVTGGFTALGFWRAHFGTHHNLSRASSALFDLMQIVARGLPPSCRATLGTAQLNAGGDWRLTHVVPPPPGALEVCAQGPR